MHELPGFTCLSGSSRALPSPAYPGLLDSSVSTVLVSSLEGRCIDYGEIRCEADNPDLCGDIYGLGAGIAIVDDNFSGLLSWGHPLQELADDIGSEDVFLLDFRWEI